MKPPHEESAARTCAVCCDVTADAVVRVGSESVPELRRNPGCVHGEPLPASFLKHADEQTVAGLAAVFKAIQNTGLQATSFTDWGVLAAPRFLGRPAMAAALQRFRAEGAWGVSPHLIPHRSLHSISGTVSQALKIHGPNFGVGGGPGGAAEAVLAATALLEGKKLPGVWLVLTCLHPEYAPDDAGQAAPGTECVGLALALTPARSGSSRVRLRVVCGQPAEEGTESTGCGFDLVRLCALLDLLRGGRGGETRVVQRLDHGTRIELVRPGASVADRIAPVTWPRGLESDSDRGSVVLADC